MKKLLSALFFLVFLYSCCDGPYQVAVVHITYPNSTESHEVLLIQTKPNTDFEVIDTFSFGEIKDENDYTLLLELDSMVNYILYVEGTNYRDTISDVYIQRESKSCNPGIEYFEYLFNGELRTDYQIVITEENESDYTNATVKYLGEIASDGCGWVLQIENINYKPTNLTVEYKVDGLEVKVIYEILESQSPCGFSKPINEILIKKIKKKARKYVPQ